MLTFVTACADDGNTVTQKETPNEYPAEQINATKVTGASQLKVKLTGTESLGRVRMQAGMLQRGSSREDVGGLRCRPAWWNKWSAACIGGLEVRCCDRVIEEMLGFRRGV